MPTSHVPPGTGRVQFAVLSVGLLALFALLAFIGYLAGWFGAAHGAAVATAAFVAAGLALFIFWRLHRFESALQESWRDQTEMRLQESERRYSELVEQAVTGFVVRRPDGQLILMNDAYCRMTGYSREELLELRARDMVVDQTVLEKVANLKSGESTQIETLMKCKGGELKEVQYVTQRRSDGNLQSVLLDISDRKRIERAREESERRYAELVDQALEGILVRRQDGRFLFVNDTFCRMLGYSRDELLGLRISDIVHPDDAETIAQVQALQMGRHLQLRKRMLRKDGRVLHVQVSARRLHNGDIQSTVQDISEQTHSELRFRSMVEGAPNAMIMVDGGGVITLANPQAEKLFGYSSDELLGRPVEMLVPERLRATHPDMRASYHRSPQMRAMGAGRDLYGLRKDGREVPVEIGLNPIVTAEGHFVLASIIDITERKAAEERFRAVVEGAPNAIVMVDGGGYIRLVNAQAEKLFDYRRDDLLGKPIEMLIPQRYRSRHPGLRTGFQRAPQARGMGTGRDLYAVRRDGREVPVEIGLNPIVTPDGHFVLASIIDITERKAAEERFRAVVEGSPSAIIMVDTNGTIALVNSQTEKLFGYGREELLGKPIETLLPERYRARHPGLRGGFLHDPRVRSMGAGRELFGLRRDGSEVPVEIGLNPITTEAGRFVLASVIDITERRHAEQAREESERRYYELVEQAADSIWLRTPDGHMMFVNEAACQLLGYTREELLGSRSLELIHPLDPGTASSIDALGKFETLRIERIMRHKDGRPIPVEASARRLADGSVQVITRDISERKASETRERSYMDELRTMSQQLLQAQETERRAIARELHDEVGQSLTATRLNLRDLEMQAAEGPLAARLGATSAIVADLLAKVRQMSLDLHPSVLDDLGLGAALRWCVRTRAGDSGLEVSYDLPPEMPRLAGMAEITLFRVFQEALSNVLKHAGAKRLAVSLRHADGRVDMTLKDDGRGFDAEAARRNALSGRSLGMVGMEERVRLAGGELAVVSAPGEGTEIRVSLPAVARDAEGVTE